MYLLGTVIIIISSIWGGASGHNYKSLLWARVFQGVGLAPFEAVVNASVGDLYFVHERGKRMALTNLALFGGAFFTPVIVGKMTSTLGWKWCFYMVAIFAGAMLPLVVFFCPETAFVRPEHLNIDTSQLRAGKRGDAGSTDTHQMYDVENNHAGSSEKNVQRDHITPLPAAQNDSDSNSANNTGLSSPPTTYPRPTFAQTLLPFNGRKINEPYLKLLLRPLPLFLHPAVAWGCLI